MDLLMEYTDPKLVDFELDVYWVITAGADPLEYIKKYPNRYPLSHLKDRSKNAPPDERDASCDLGTGSIDLPAIVKLAQQNGMKYFILEQEKYEGSTPLKSAEAGARYLQKLSFS